MKYELRNSTTTTSSGASRTYVANLVVVKLPWWKRLWRRAKRAAP